MIFKTPNLDEQELLVLDEIQALAKSLDRQLQIHAPRRWFGSIRRAAMARAIQGSNSIEGFNAQVDDAAAIELGEKTLSADEEAQLALKGYRDALTYVLQRAEDPDFEYSSGLLKSLHFMMTSHDLKNRPGQWRVGAIYVKKEDTGEIVYEGPDVSTVPGLIEELAVELRTDTRTPALVRAGMAHLNLVMIHPFRDGNGRMSRCLQTLVIARDGSAHPIFSSIEEYLGANTPAYYDVLGEVGGGKWQPERDARPWVRFVLKAHLFQVRRLIRRVRRDQRLWTELEELAKEHSLPDRTLLALFDAGIRFRVRNSTYRAADPDEISEMTASRDLRLLVKAGLLEPHGEKRGRYYLAGSQILDIRKKIMASEGPLDLADPFVPGGAAGANQAEQQAQTLTH